MKTQAVRMKDGMVALIEAIAEAEQIKPADVHRRAIADYAAKMAKRHPDTVGKLRDQVIAAEKQEVDEEWAIRTTP